MKTMNLSTVDRAARWAAARFPDAQRLFCHRRFNFGRGKFPRVPQSVAEESRGRGGRGDQSKAFAVLAVGGSPTGTGKLPVPPIFQTVPNMGRRGTSALPILGLFVFLGANPAFSQIQQAWVARYNNGIANGNHQALKMALDGSGNIYITGFSQNTNGQSGYATITTTGTMALI